MSDFFLIYSLPILLSLLPLPLSNEEKKKEGRETADSKIFPPSLLSLPFLHSLFPSHFSLYVSFSLLEWREKGDKDVIVTFLFPPSSLLSLPPFSFLLSLPSVRKQKGENIKKIGHYKHSFLRLSVTVNVKEKRKNMKERELRRKL